MYFSLLKQNSIRDRKNSVYNAHVKNVINIKFITPTSFDAPTHPSDTTDHDKQGNKVI